MFSICSSVEVAYLFEHSTKRYALKAVMPVSRPKLTHSTMKPVILLSCLMTKYPVYWTDVFTCGTWTVARISAEHNTLDYEESMMRDTLSGQYVALSTVVVNKQQCMRGWGQ